VLIAILYVVLNQKWVAVNDLPMSLIGSALAIFISLRNNNLYARWWEARKLWGGEDHAKSWEAGAVGVGCELTGEGWAGSEAGVAGKAGGGTAVWRDHRDGARLH